MFYSEDLVTAAQIFSLYLTIFTVQLLWELLLIKLNMQYVAANAASVPTALTKHIEEESYKRSVVYTLTKARFGIFSLLYSAATLLVFIVGGGFGYCDALVTSFGLGAYTTGVVYVLFLSLIFSLFGIPLGLYSTFVIEERFGFNKTTVRLWCEDLLKGAALSTVIMVPLVYALLWFMNAAGAFWWVYAALFLIAVQILLLYLYPAWIAPLFNKFTPLQEGSLKEKISALAARTGFGMSGVYVMDGSKRSGHGNAYFTGFGRNKRIVLFDTLIQNLSEEQVEAVLAHEIGHEKKHHIKKMLCFSVLFILAGFWVLSLLLGYQPLFDAFGFRSPSNYAGLVLISFAFEPVTYFIGPLFAVLSRRFEYQADHFAMQATGSADHLIGALLALSKKNLSNLTPHPWFSFFHYSHPTLLERIDAMRRHAEPT